MLKTLCLLLALTCVLFGCKPPVAPGDPAARLQGFFAAYSSGNIEEIRKYILDARPSKTIDDLFGKNPSVKMTGVIKDVNVAGDTAHIKLDLVVGGNPHQDQVAYMKYSKGDWYLDRDPETMNNPADYIGGLASMIKNEMTSQEADNESRCIANVKKLTLALLQVSSRSNDVMAVTSRDWKEKVDGYVKDPSVYECPMHGGYSVNPELYGVATSKIAQPAETVLVYEGANERPDVRHDAETVIGFADGHVKAVDSAKLSTLRWKP